MTGGDLEVRIVAAQVLLRMAKAATHPDEVVRLIQGVQAQCIDIIQMMDADVAEQALVAIQAAVFGANQNGGS